MQALGRPVSHHRLHLPEDRLQAEAVLERAGEELDELRELAVDEGLVEDAGQEVLEELERIERLEVDLHLARRRDPPAELRDGELALPLDVAVGLGKRAGEHETPHAPRMPERQLLGDHAAHRHADDVGARDPHGVEEAGRVVGHVVHGVRAGRSGAPPHTPVVEGDRAIAAGEVGNLEQPGTRVGGEPHDEEQRVPVPALLVVELDRADLRRAHCSNQPCMT